MSNKKNNIMGQYSKFPKLQVEDLGTEGTGDIMATFAIPLFLLIAEEMIL